MKYGDGLWHVKDGVRVLEREFAYPKTVGFEYGDGDVGEFLLEDFTMDYIPPGERRLLRMTVAGDQDPRLHENSFDFDFASIPKPFRLTLCDKADHRVRVGSLFHDILYCTHTFSRAFTDRMFIEICEAYGLSSYLRFKIRIGVRALGYLRWSGHEHDAHIYEKLLKVEEIAL